MAFFIDFGNWSRLPCPSKVAGFSSSVVDEIPFRGATDSTKFASFA